MWKITSKNCLRKINQAVTLYFIIILQELFIKRLAEESYKDEDRNKLDYDDVAEVVQIEDVYSFLRGMNTKSYL